MPGPPPKTTQDRTQTQYTHPIPGHKLKFLTPPGIECWPPGVKAGTLYVFYYLTVCNIFA